MNNFIGYNMQDPKMLINEILELSKLIDITLVCLKKYIYSPEAIHQCKEDLTGAIEETKVLQIALDNNLWHIVTSSIRSHSDLLKEWEILFDSARLMWIAEKLIQGKFLSNPQTVSTSIGMLEALMPAVNPASVALTVSDLNSVMVAKRIQYHFHVTQSVIETMARSSGFKNSDELIQETLKQVESVIQQEKKKRK